jgi:hypothetical protein
MEMNRRRMIKRELASVGLGSSSSSSSGSYGKAYSRVLTNIQKMFPTKMRKKRVRFHPRKWKGKFTRAGATSREISNRALQSAMQNVLRKMTREQFMKGTKKTLYRNLAERTGLNYENIVAKKKLFSKIINKQDDIFARVKKPVKIMKILRRRKPKTYIGGVVTTIAPTLLRSSASSGSGSSSSRRSVISSGSRSS